MTSNKEGCSYIPSDGLIGVVDVLGETIYLTQEQFDNWNDWEVIDWESTCARTDLGWSLVSSHDEWQEMLAAGYYPVIGTDGRRLYLTEVGLQSNTACGRIDWEATCADALIGTYWKDKPPVIGEVA